MGNETILATIRRVRATYDDDSVNWHEIANQVNSAHGTNLSAEATRSRYKRSRGKDPPTPDLIFPKVNKPEDLSFP